MSSGTLLSAFAGEDCEGTALVPELLGKYWQKERQALASRESTRSKESTSEEVLVKLVRPGPGC